MNQEEFEVKYHQKYVYCIGNQFNFLKDKIAFVTAALYQWESNLDSILGLAFKDSPMITIYISIEKFNECMSDFQVVEE